MGVTEKLRKSAGITENVIFVFAFGFIMYQLILSYGGRAYGSLKGHGYLATIINPILKHQYSLSAAAVIIILNSTLFLWEIASLMIQLVKQEGSNAKGYDKYKLVFKKVLVTSKSPFLALLFLDFLPRLVTLNV